MFMNGGYLLILITNSFVPLPLLGFLFSLYTTILRCASCIELLSAVFTSMPDSLATPELYMDVLSCNIYIYLYVSPAGLQNHTFTNTHHITYVAIYIWWIITSTICVLYTRTAIRTPYSIAHCGAYHTDTERMWCISCLCVETRSKLWA